MCRNRYLILQIFILATVCFSSQAAIAGDFFSIKKAEIQGDHLLIQVATRDTKRSDDVYAKAYFFDEKRNLLKEINKPGFKSQGKSNAFNGMPVVFQKQKVESMQFPIPKEVNNQKWIAVVVFGDPHEAAARSCPGDMPLGIDYAEKAIVDGKAGGVINRKAEMDPLIEYVATTSNPKQPKITLFLRAPDGVTNPAEIQGVMALCLLGNHADDIKRQLQQINIGSDVKNMIGFANKNKLAILCWGTGPVLWDRGVNYDRVAKADNRIYDKAFDQVADGWERGIKDLQQKYGLPDHNYLLVGLCASGQWAHRLAMRKPDYFLAAYIHEPTSFDAPTAEASKVMWLLTDGEMDYGYNNAVSFYKDCRKMGYPMIFKPIMHLGHSRSPVAENLANKFFEYALSVKNQREAYDKLQKDPLAQMSQKTTAVKGPWLESFRAPEFYGDYQNQECYPASQVNMISEALRVPLPTKELADLWNK